MTPKVKSQILSFVMVVIIIIGSFGASVVFDRLAGGPDARAAARASERLLSFQQQNLERTLCVSDITTRREIAKAESDSAANALNLYVLDLVTDRTASADNERAQRLKARITAADVQLGVALIQTQLQPLICPAPKPPTS